MSTKTKKPQAMLHPSSY